jgi:hypothetical protein
MAAVHVIYKYTKPVTVKRNKKSAGMEKIKMIL